MCLLLGLAPLMLQAEEYAATVVSVTAGDRLVLRHGSRTETIRLYGIACPEPRQPFGDRARTFVKTALAGATVQVMPLAKDRSGRIIADVFLPDGQLLNYLLVKEGYAWWARREALDHPLLEQLEANARKAKRGLWSQPHPIPPWEWRRGRTGGARASEPSTSTPGRAEAPPIR